MSMMMVSWIFHPCQRTCSTLQCGILVTRQDIAGNGQSSTPQSIEVGLGNFDVCVQHSSSCINMNNKLIIVIFLDNNIAHNNIMTNILCV